MDSEPARERRHGQNERGLAVGRNNWLFAGSDDSAERACVLHSLVASCKLHGVNAFEYLRDVLVRVGDHRASDVLALSPKAWKQEREHRNAAQAPG